MDKRTYNILWAVAAPLGEKTGGSNEGARNVYVDPGHAHETFWDIENHLRSEMPFLHFEMPFPAFWGIILQNSEKRFQDFEYIYIYIECF